jgi:hypothetical protein
MVVEQRRGDDKASPGKAWPTWAKALVSCALLFHASAIWAGAWAAAPASSLQHSFADLFDRYNQVIDQGVSYRYYSPEPPPTPVILATVSFADGRPEATVRLPTRGTWPRLRYQRQLALANGLMEDFQEARQVAGDGSKSRWAQAFATHLRRLYPGCSTVTLRLQMHLVPPIDRVRELRDHSSDGKVDLDADEFTTAPERIGVFPCDGS